MDPPTALLRGRQRWVDLVGMDGAEVGRDAVRLPDGRWARTLAVVGYPRSVQPGWLQPLYAFPAEMRVAAFVEPVETGAAVAALGRHARTLRASLLLSEARQAVPDAYDQAALGDALGLRAALARGEVRLFTYHLFVTLLAPDRSALDRLTAALNTELEGRMLILRRCLLQQGDAFVNTLPLGQIRVPAPRTLDSEALATTYPFAGGAFASAGDEVWGRDLDYPCLVTVPRWQQGNAHVLCVAASGAGKSYWLKHLLTMNLLAGRDAVVIDPQGEYAPWADALGGTVVRLGQDGRRINPLAAAPGAAAGAAERAERLVVALQLLGELPAAEVSSVRQAVAEAFRRAPQGPCLADVATALRGQTGSGPALASRLDGLRAGALAIFDGASDIPRPSPLLVLDVSALLRQGPQWLACAYYLVAGFVLDALLPPAGRQLTLAVDEAHHLLAQPSSAAFIEQLFRTGRKRAVAACLLTQSVGDLLGQEASPAAARAARAALANAATVLLMRQQNGREVEWLQRLYGLDPGEARWLLGCGRGEGLVLSGGRRARVRIEAPAALHALFASGSSAPAAGPDAPPAAAEP